MSRGNGGAMLKAKRQQAILSLVGRERMSSQAEIRDCLGRLGLDATQSTISRDIEELGLARIHDHDGVRYVILGEGAAPGPRRLLRRLLQEFALGLVPSGNILVVRTPPGAASALGEGIDRVGLSEIAGTVAGDNTILVVAREGTTARQVQRALEELMEER